MPIQLPPGPRSRRLLGYFPELINNPLHALVNCRQYGEIACFNILNRHIYVLNHPDYIRHVLVDNHRNYVKGRTLTATRRVLGTGLLTSEGEFHRRQRRLVQPAFHRQRIAGYAEIMSRFTERHLSQWQDGEALDLHRDLMTLTMKIVAKCLFDADVSGEADEVGEALGGLLDEFSLIDVSPLGRLLERLPTPRQNRRRRRIEFLNALVYGLIAERRATGDDKGDLLSMLLQAQDVEGDGTGMTDEQVRDEVMTLFLAGHETTANALAWTFYLLACHPQVESKLHTELDTALGGRAPTPAHLPSLPYTRRVFSEAMRLYPPAWVIGRMALDDDQIGGYAIPKGSTVLISQYVMHRHPQYWDDPEAFIPERFDPAADKQPLRHVYFPFGGGPRLCIGEPFAWMEGDLLTAHIAGRYSFALQPSAHIEPEPSITLRPKHGLPVVAKLRRRATA